MVTGEVKNKIDNIWDTFWTGGITMQEEYLKTIIAYVCKNGDITAQTIVNEPPFDAFDWAAVFEGELPNIGRYVNMLHDSIVA